MSNPPPVFMINSLRILEKRSLSLASKDASEDLIQPSKRPTRLSHTRTSSSTKRKVVRSLPTPETSPERPSRKRNSANRASETIAVACLTPPASDCEDDCHNKTLTSESERSIEFPLSRHALPDLRGATPQDTTQAVRQKGIKSGSWRIIPKPSNDRFISNRASDFDLSHTYRATKAVKDLNKSEKLLRDSSATPDPFGRLILPRVREQSNGSSRNRQRLTRPNRARSRTIGTYNVIGLPVDRSALQNRQVSAGAIWNVGGSGPAVQAGPVRAISNGRGGFLSSGSNAPMYIADFLEEHTQDQEIETMQNRIAEALGIDQTERLISTVRTLGEVRSASTDSIGLQKKQSSEVSKTKWINGEWVRSCSSLLDAPLLRDDYYCTVLAYCSTLRTLAVGLANRVYLWSEELGVRYPPDDPITRPTAYVTSLSFSSADGGLSILAIGRNTGQICLWSLNDDEHVRFRAQHSTAISCVAFKPVTTQRVSERFGSIIATEELLVGDEKGDIFYYSIEWMTRLQADIHGWSGSMKLLLKISIHSQQICGLAWSPDGDYFASGANDNACCLFQVNKILKADTSSDAISFDRRPLQTLVDEIGLPKNPAALLQAPVIATLGDVTVSGHRLSRRGVHIATTITGLHSISEGPSRGSFLLIGDGRQKHKWIHSAAVKAIAFCPWQRGLIATGGGSNDRAIHFYHTFSGACLATINVYAQVTSLIWSNTRREIAATFGYAQPEHPYRIAVFSWPECRQIVAIPWPSENRALLAIAYPRGPGETRHQRFGEQWYSRTAEEGCIVVACSDESVKFHEVWSGTARSTGCGPGLLGGSTILEALEGIDRETSEIIR